MKCPKCQKENEGNFCSACGTRLETTSQLQLDSEGRSYGKYQVEIMHKPKKIKAKYLIIALLASCWILFIVAFPFLIIPTYLFLLILVIKDRCPNAKKQKSPVLLKECIFTDKQLLVNTDCYSSQENKETNVDDEKRQDYIALVEELKQLEQIESENQEQENKELDNNDSKVYMEDIDKMGGLAFEKFVAEILEKNEYKDISLTKGSGDMGVDLVASKNGVKYAIQCKCYNSNVGAKAIQEIYTGKSLYDAEIAVVVTNCKFTAQAQEMAKRLHVRLWGREEIMELAGIEDKRPVNMYTIEQPVLIANSELNQSRPMTVIGGGRYIFGVDIPLGKYDLIALSGSGILTIQTGEDFNTDWKEMCFGIGQSDAKSYRNLSLPHGWCFEIQDDVEAQITKSKMLEIL